MKTRYRCIGLVLSGESVEHQEDLETSDAIARFLKKYLFPEWSSSSSNERVAIVDVESQVPIFNAVNGVDLHSELRDYGVDLPEIYKDLNRARSDALSALSLGTSGSGGITDSIGLSSEEMVMRKETLRAAKAAKTVGDVLELVGGTYFEAYVCGWPLGESELDEGTKVAFEGSGEDTLHFDIVDPEDETG